ncbi:F-box/WD repeat-containing protein [Endozoicomonas sp. 2B-B]
MFSDVNHSVIAGSPSLPTVSTSLGEESSGVSAGMSVTVPDKEIKKTTSLHDLPEEIIVKIACLLEFRDIVSLQQVSTHTYTAIKNDPALEKAWYCRFSSLHQYQLKKILPIEDKEQLRSWLRPFTKDEALVESIIECRKSDYFPALFYFSKARLMSQYKKYIADTEAVITHVDRVNSVSFSIDGCRVVTASDDNTAIIYGQNANGSWEEKATIFHNGSVTSASFSADARHVLTTSQDGTAKIYGQETNGSWLEKVIISHDDSIRSATFSADGHHVLTSFSQHVIINKLRMDHCSFAAANKKGRHFAGSNSGESRHAF